ncbi:hypothetical protein D3C78_1621860 [compost metagenome]
MYLFSQAGHVLASDDLGVSFRPLDIGALVPVAGALVRADAGLLLVGNRGLSQRTLVAKSQE